VTNTGAVGISDAVEILMFVVKLPSVLDEGADSHAWKAALIISVETPAIGDAVEILMFVVKLASAIPEDTPRS
jgi:hypothetical protein